MMSRVIDSVEISNVEKKMNQLSLMESHPVVQVPSELLDSRDISSTNPVFQAFSKLLALTNSSISQTLLDQHKSLFLFDMPSEDGRTTQTRYFDELNSILSRPASSLPYVMSFASNPVSQLLKLFENDPQVTSVRISDSSAFGKGLILLLTNVLLNNTHIETLELVGGRLDDEALQLLSVGLCANKTLKHLSLLHNILKGDHVKTLGNVLEKNTSIMSLTLDGNFIGDEGAKQLAEILEKKTSLSEVSLKTNEIGDDGAVALAQALAGNDNLLMLDLENNFISSKGAEAIAEGISHQETKLQALNLASNMFGSSTALMFAEALKTNQALEELSLAGHNLSLEDLRVFVEAIPNNKTLSLLNLGVEPSKASIYRIKINSFALLEGRLDIYLKRNAKEMSKTTFRLEMPTTKQQAEPSYMSANQAYRSYSSVAASGTYGSMSSSRYTYNTAHSRMPVSDYYGSSYASMGSSSASYLDSASYAQSLSSVLSYMSRMQGDDFYYDDEGFDYM